MPWSSNATFLVHVEHAATVAPGDLQADAGRASAVGLRARPPPPRGRGLPAERGAGVAWSRRPCCATARSARGRCSGSSRRPSPALLHDLRGAPRAARPAAGDGAARHHRQQHRPQEWSLPARRATTARPRCGASIRGSASLAEYKLRTVIWEFGGEPIPDALLETVRAARATRVPLEIAALLERCRGRGDPQAERRGREASERSRPTERPALPVAAGMRAVGEPTTARRG